MLRKDGLSTNSEMLASLTEISRQIYIETLGAKLEAGLPPAYLGKPLSLVGLNVTTLYSPESSTVLDSERLQISPIHNRHITHLESNGYPSSTDIELRRQQAAVVGAAVLSPNIELKNVLHENHVATRYSMRSIDGKVQQVDTLTEHSSETVIAGAAAYAKDYLRYLLNSHDVPEDPFAKLLQYVNRNKGYSERTLAEDTWAQFNFVITPELPLNGHESTGFLRRYYGRMRESLITYLEQLEQPQDDPAKKIKLDEEMSRYSDARARAKEILEARGERI